MDKLPSYLYDPTPFAQRFGNWVETNHGGIISAWGTALKDPTIAVPVYFTVFWLVFVIGLYVWERRDKGKKMGKLQISRKRGIKIEDRITDIIEDLRYKDLISAEEKRMMYRFLADATGLKNLVPHHPKEVKNRVKKRIKEGVHHAKVNIPGEQPLSMEEIVENKVTPLKRAKPKYSGVLALRKAS